MGCLRFWKISSVPISYYSFLFLATEHGILRWQGKLLEKKSSLLPHFGHILTVTPWTMCPHSPALPLSCIDHSQSGLWFHWVHSSTYCLLLIDQPTLFPLLTFIYSLPSESPWASMIMIFWPTPWLPLLCCHFVPGSWQTPTLNEAFCWLAPHTGPQVAEHSWRRLTGRRAITPHGHRLLWGFHMLGNPTMSPDGALPCQVFTYLQHFSLLQTLDFCSSHLHSNSQQKT